MYCWASQLSEWVLLRTNYDLISAGPLPVHILREDCTLARSKVRVLMAEDLMATAPHSLIKSTEWL